MVKLFYKPDFKIAPAGIDQIEEIVLGGVNQKFLIQSCHMDNPILLFIHGGPSMPLPGISSRGKDYTVATNTKKLVQHYTLVFWDQRGTGLSYNKNIPEETMNLDQFVKDANELTDYLLNKFNHSKLYLAGHSFGSLIAIHLVDKHPNKFYSYTGLSQIIDWTENDRLSLNWLKGEAEKRKDSKALKELDSVGEPPFVESYKQWSVLRKWQMKYGTMIYSNDEIKHPGFFKVMQDMLLSKDYRVVDIVNTLYRGFKLIYTDDFIKSIPSFNVQKNVLNLKVPTTFIHGSKDVHVHPEPLLAYVNSLQTENKPQLIWMEKSSHLFHPDDTAIIEDLLIEKLSNSNQNSN